MAYPITNRRDRMHIDVYYIRSRVGRALGFDINPAVWDDEQLQIVTEVIDDGLQLAYFPPPIGPPYVLGEIESHPWSFLEADGRLTTQADQRYYDAPEGLDDIIVNISFMDDGDSFHPIEQTSNERLLALEGRVSGTAYPELYAIRNEESSGESPQLKQIGFHPTPSGAYRLGYRYRLEARRLTDENPYPLGGQPFGNVVLAACLAIAEERITGKQGTSFKSFMQKLATAIGRDHRNDQKLLGYNGNRSTRMIPRSQLRRTGLLDGDFLTYGGVEYLS